MSIYGTPQLLEAPCLPQGAGSIPNVPDAPIVTKSCIDQSITVSNPAWNTDDDHVTRGVQVRRSSDAGATWNIVHTFASEDSAGFVDNSVDVGAYLYQVRGIDGFEASQWSASVSISLVSETLELAWLAPAADAELANKIELRFSLDDSGETLNECGDPVVSGSCTAPAPAITLWLDGLELPAPVLVSGTPRGGEYSLLLDTRDFANGARVLRARAQGTDCCWAEVSRAIEFQNTLRSGVRYVQTDYPFAPPAGSQYSQTEVSFQNESLYANPSRCYWVLNGLASAPIGVDFSDSEITEAAKAEAFEAMKSFTMRRGQIGSTPDRAQFFATPALSPAGDEIHWVQQWTPEQSLSFHTTGCERVAKIRNIADGEDLIVALSADGSAARVFSFELGVLTLKRDLAVHGAADALDAALNGDKLFVATPSKLLAIDLDPGQVPLRIMPDGETRAPRFVEKVGVATIAVFVDEDLSEERTRVYDLTFGAPKLLWALDAAATLVFPIGQSLAVACGPEYFTTDAIATAPSLDHTFDSDVAAISESRVKLQSGAIWRKGDSAWIEEVEGGNPGAGAVGAWESGGDDLRGVAGGESPQLVEQLSNGQWIDGRSITPGAGMTESIDAITVLARHEKIVTPAIGEPGQPGFVPAIKKVALLIGTAPDGVLAVLEVSGLSEEAGAIKVSRASHYNIDAFASPTGG